jgi:Mg2+ and Co2+ transporter CorA
MKAHGFQSTPDDLTLAHSSRTVAYMRKLGGALLGVMLMAALTGCSTTYYRTMEMFGKEKRDILKSRVKEARDEQQKTAEQFKDALTRLRELYGSSGTDLEKMYDRLKSEYDSSAARANSVHERIAKMETVARDLFKEWDKEIGEISSASLKEDSRRKLRDTQLKFDQLDSSMKRAEASLTPVLKQFQDQTLYLKHNLNAQALGTLKNEAADIEREVSKLIEDMNTSIKQADSFIQGLKD